MLFLYTYNKKERTGEI